MKSRLCFQSMLYRQKSILSLVLIFSFAISAQDIKAKVELPSLLSSGMIVQRGEPVRLWGVADPGETVVVSAVCWENGVEASIGEENVIADYNGKWAVELPALKAGGPYEITVNDVTLKNILSGDVFLCSGQSNMKLLEMRMAQAEAAQALPGVVLIRNSDLGEWNDIHPLDKKTLATRVVDEIVLRMR